MYVTLLLTLCYGEQITLYCMPKMMQCTVHTPIRLAACESCSCPFNLPCSICNI